MKRKIVIAGGTGSIGSALVKHFSAEGDEIMILTRSARDPENNVRYVQWDAESPGDWQGDLENSDLLINLAGKSVNCRPTEKNKREIMESRVKATRVLGKAVGQCKKAPKVWINASTAAIFGDLDDEIKTETSDYGDGFSAEVSKQWELAFEGAEAPNTRRVVLRIALVLQKNGGIIQPFKNLARVGLGGTIGSGNQHVSWIHEQDFIQLIEWVYERDTLSGAINAVSPFPVSNAEFMKGIRSALGVSVGLPNPAFLTQIGAFFMGTDADLVLSGRRVVSDILKEQGFPFLFPHYQQAISDLLKS